MRYSFCPQMENWNDITFGRTKWPYLWLYCHQVAILEAGTASRILFALATIFFQRSCCSTLIESYSAETLLWVIVLVGLCRYSRRWFAGTGVPSSCPRSTSQLPSPSMVSRIWWPCAEDSSKLDHCSEQLPASASFYSQQSFRTPCTPHSTAVVEGCRWRQGYWSRTEESKSWDARSIVQSSNCKPLWRP